MVGVRTQGSRELAQAVTQSESIEREIRDAEGVKWSIIRPTREPCVEMEQALALEVTIGVFDRSS